MEVLTGKRKGEAGSPTAYNTPIRDLSLSLAQLLFCHAIKDLLPQRHGSTVRQRELALRHKVSIGEERWSEHTEPIQDLQPE